MRKQKLFSLWSEIYVKEKESLEKDSMDFFILFSW
jgi:hypothetical protein